MLATKRMIAACAIATATVFSIGTPASATAAPPAPVRGFHAFSEPGFSGPEKWFSGEVDGCYYVGDNWNDTINSARTESSRVVELWDNHNCTGGAIVIDSTGYNSIGNWVSGYRIR